MDSTEKMLQDALNMGLGNVARILSQCVEPRRRSSSADQEEKREQPPKEDSRENEKEKRGTLDLFKEKYAKLKEKYAKLKEEILRDLEMLGTTPKKDFDANEKRKEDLFYCLTCEDEEISSKAKSIAEDLGYPTPTDLFRSLSEPNKKKIMNKILKYLHDDKRYKRLRGLRMLKALPEEDFQKNENLKKALFYSLFHENEDVRSEAESVITHFDYTPETLCNSLQNKQERDELAKKIMDELSNRLAKERDPENSVAFELLSKLRGILQRAQATDDASTVAHKDFAFGNTQGKGKAKENALKN